MFQPPAHLTVPLAGMGAPGIGRHALGELLTDADAELRDGALLVVSELVTNAIQAAEQCTMSAWFLADHGAVRIEVSDESQALPAIRPLTNGRVGGYGLRIVEHISTHWGVVEHDDGGKTTWSEIASPTTA